MTTEQQQHDAVMAYIAARYQRSCRRDARRRLAVRAAWWAMVAVLGVALATGLIAFAVWTSRFTG